MSLELDARQRAMLQEMGVHVWLPGPAFAVEVADAKVSAGSGAASNAGSVVGAVAVAVAGTKALPPAIERSPAAGLSAQGGVAARQGNSGSSATLPPSSLQLQGLDWAGLAQTANDCQACGLCAGRKQSTLCPPAQLGQADWLVVGDAPDDEEDQAGHPFAGDAGVLLANMLKAMGARQGETGAAGAYATNIVKCRPPVGRMPQAAELAQCAAYLQRELALVQPKVILAMGRFAIQLLLSEHPQQVGMPLGKQRGVVYRYQGFPVIVTYAPKVLLRASADKGKAWADLCLALDVRDGIALSTIAP